VSWLSYMLMRDAQNIASIVEEYREVAHAATYTIYPIYSIYSIYSIYNYSLRLMIFIQFRRFTHNSKS